MWCACKIRIENIVKYLFEHGTDVFKKNKSNEIPLTQFFVSGNNNILNYFQKK